MTKQEFLKKYDEGYEFNEKEIKNIVFDYEHQVDEIEGEDHSWQKEMKTIVNFGDRYFAIDWMSGLTEHQENDFLEQPYEVEKKVRVVTETYWEKI